MHNYQVAYAQLAIPPEQRCFEFRTHHPFRPHSIGVWHDFVAGGVHNQPVIHNFQIAHSRELVMRIPAMQLRPYPQNVEPREFLENLLSVPKTEAMRFEHVRTNVQNYQIQLQPNLNLIFKTASAGQTIKLEWSGCLSAVVILGYTTHLMNDPLQIHGKTIPDLLSVDTRVKHRDDLRRIPEEDVPMVDTYEEQVLEWVKGRFCHVRVGASFECCPDFSCCYPDCAHTFEVREKFADGDSKVRHDMYSKFLSEFVGKLRPAGQVRVIS